MKNWNEVMLVPEFNEQGVACYRLDGGDYLNEYYIKTSVGSSVDLLSNVKEIKDDTDNVSELWRRIQINGQVNTYTPGTYTCSYYVVDSAGNMSNTAELTVIVQ